jgi:stage V sporulation protein R
MTTFLEELEVWDNTLCKMAKDHGLDWFELAYETCDYFEMIGSMAYHGMPSHYAHWSFGKSFERNHLMYNTGQSGLPYELIINSDPSLAYLMEENPMYLQVLIMAHCIGHSDFFKNNVTFQHTHPENIILRMRNAKRYVNKLIEDPSIGVEAVEKILDSAHALSMNIPKRYNRYIPYKQQRAALVADIKSGVYDDAIIMPDVDAMPLKQEENILALIADLSPNLEDWQRELILIVEEEAHYFMPQIRTKIMNEGWASYWHYRLMHELELPSGMHIPFLKTHNEVIRPHPGSINPYHLGFYLFKKIEERHGLEECFIARESLNDESFIRQYLTQEDCEELELFSYSLHKDEFKVDDVSDEQGWKNIREDLIKQVGGNSIPIIAVDNINESNVLCLIHEHDGRDLELDYADAVCHHISALWGDVVKLDTIIEDEPFEI